jgi:hypothetical protein
MDLFYAFLGGAGVDVIGNRIAGKVGSGSFPLSSGEPPKDVDNGAQDSNQKDT